jgi:RND family efflux transporter MFP subunit
MVEAAVVANRRTAVALFGASLVVTLGTGCKRETVTAPPPPEVSISQPVEEPVQEALEFTGRTSAVESVEVRARVTGYITKVDFVEGARVNVGDLLFEIDPREYEAAVLRAEGQVARLRSQLARTQAEVGRNQALRPSGAASARELERAIADQGAVEGELKANLAQLETARLDVEFSKVTAPVAGRVSRAEITAGNLVVVGATGGPLLTTVVSLDPIYVNFDADERALIRLRKASIARDGVSTPENVRNAALPVFVGLADEPDFPHKGTINFLDNQVDPSTGTIHVRAVLENKDGLLTPGLFVRVRMPVSEPKPGLLVTDRAIGTDQDRKYVLVVNDKNVVEYRQVKLGGVHGGLRAVAEGLAPGDWVIVNGIQRARPGATVAPQKVSMRPAPPAGGAPAQAAPAGAAPAESAPAEPNPPKAGS